MTHWITVVPRLRFGLVAILLAVPTSRADQPGAEGLEFFEKKIRPLLADNCYKCHGPEKPKGGLRLDSRAGVLKGGDNGPALVPFEPEKSRLVKAIRYDDTDLRMPLKGKLSNEQIALLTEWVKKGAPMPDGAVVGGGPVFNLEERKKHWSFQPLKVGAVPGVKNREWVRNPIDAHILAALEAKGLSPAAPADKRALLRRVTHDLTGLPPTAAEIKAFLDDANPQAYERVVDRLLESPHYGERWGRHWLDLVRYAETSGHEFDFELPLAWRYRDYVVRALNADVPYDQFVIEHVAGDLLQEPRRHPKDGFNESVIGTGAFWLGESKHSPVDVRAEGAERADNQIDVLSKAFLGLTVSCARCHDHKFDAISTKDYYALAGYLRSSRFQRAAIDEPEPRRAVLDKLRKVREQASALAIEDRVGTLERAIEQLFARKGEPGVDLRDSGPVFQTWLALGAGNKELPAAEFTARRKALVEQMRATRPKVVRAHQTFVDFKNESLEGWFVTGEAFGDRPARSLDVTGQGAMRLMGPGVAHSGVLGHSLEGTLRSPTFTIGSKRILYRVAGKGTKINLIIDGFQKIQDPIYGGLTFAVNHGEELRWHTQDVSMWVGHRAYIECLDEGDGWLALDRVLFSDQGPPAEGTNPSLIRLLDDDTLDSREKLGRKYALFLSELVAGWGKKRVEPSPEDAALIDALIRSESLMTLAGAPTLGQKESREKVAALRKEAEALERSLPKPTYVMAMADGTGENEKVFIRGNHKTPGEEASRRFLEAIAGKEQPVPDNGSGRLGLARRMASPENPLTARVMVNRLWHHHFGSGIVKSVDDFGIQGTGPTHPELLDWLASEFVRQGWSLKKMHRLMVLSSTYRQASRADAKADELDPENKLLHRMPIRRLEAEAIRDAILSASGRLDRKLYGPPVMPHLTPHMQGRGRPGSSGPLDGDGRRSLYVNVRRNFLTPLFLAFDYPVPFTTIGRRTVSNVPAQALAMMNNPFVRQQAGLWAKRVLAEKKPAKERIADLYETAFGRLPTDGELGDALGFLEAQGDNLAGWTELCHVLFNVKEFIFVN